MLCLLTGDGQEAEDLMQDAFVRLHERWERISSLDDPTGYLLPDGDKRLGLSGSTRPTRPGRR